MKVLVIERDRDVCDQLQALFQAKGAEVVFEPTKNTAMEMLRKDPTFDVVLYDPTPQNEIRSFIMGARRSTNTFPPFVILSHNMNLSDVIAAGGNEMIKKPIDSNDVIKKVTDAARITAVSRLMADESEDFPSKEGIIAKSAFNQLFITCLDRADRHGEKSLLIFVSIDNLDEIVQNDGAEEAAKVANNLRKNISRTRRTSDIAGHIKQAEFCLLVLRPMKDDEAFLAANRFAEGLKSNIDIIGTSKTKAVIKVWLVSIPSGEIPVQHIIKAE